jgi:Cu+-exporting ATPase
MFVAIGGRPGGIVAVADRVKETTAEAIEALHGAGLRVIMATGDNRRTAEAVAGPLGIDDIRAEVSPEDKAALIEELQGQGLKVAMAGDGVRTTRRRWPPPMSASPWAPAPTSRSRAPASPW